MAGVNLVIRASEPPGPDRVNVFLLQPVTTKARVTMQFELSCTLYIGVYTPNSKILSFVSQVELSQSQI